MTNVNEKTVMIFHSMRSEPPEDTVLVFKSGSGEDTCYWVGQYKYGHCVPLNNIGGSTPTHYYCMGVALGKGIVGPEEQEALDKVIVEKFNLLRQKIDRGELVLSPSQLF